VLERYVIEERGRPDCTFARLLVLLHGYGASEHDLAATGPLVDPDGHYLVVGLRAPLPVEGGGWSWFEAGPRGPVAASLRAAVDGVHESIADLCATRGFDPAQTVLGGFSQGGAVALAAAFTTGAPVRPAGVLAWSTYLPDAEGFELDPGAAATVPVLVQHGTDDEFVHIELGRGTAHALAAAGVPVIYREYPMTHQTTVESLADARDWLARVRSGARPSEPQG
jgi:phospholipase/carboxylesterase